MPELVILIILISLSAFFSGVELATMSLSLLKVRTLVKLRKPGAESLYRIKRNPHRLLIAILIGNNLVNIAAASLVTVVATEFYGAAGAGIAVGITTLLILIFGEITPKSFAVQNGEKISLAVARPLEILIFLLLPVVVVFEYITVIISKFSAKKKILTEDDLRAIVTISKEEGVLDREAMEMIHSVLDFEETKVSKILTPKKWIKMLDEDLSITEAIKKIKTYPFDRFPIYKYNEDNVVGVIDNLDVIKNLGKRSKKLKDIATKPIFVDKNDYIDAILLKFKTRGRKMAIVLDDKKRVVGIVTIQDVVEEIIGDIFEKEIYKQRKGLG